MIPKLDLTPKALVVDTIVVRGIPKGQCDVEEILDEQGRVKPDHYKIFTTHPLTKLEKIEAISKFRNEDLTLVF